MRKEIQNVGGDSDGIRFSKKEMKAYGLTRGDIIDVGDLVRIKQRNPSRAPRHQIKAKRKRRDTNKNN